MPQNDVSVFLQGLPDLRGNYCDADIFNADETALYYNALPQRTLEERHCSASGKKISKARMTLLLCCSGSGEKLPPLVIGKFENPRCLRGMDRESLPCYYKSSKNAWMTKTIWSAWLLEINRRMVTQRRNILLIIDNATPHRIGVELSNVKVAFMPPNCTSVLQPLDQGIIWSFKCIFRQILLDYIVEGMDLGIQNSLVNGLDILKAMHFVKSAWLKVHPDTIINGFAKARMVEKSVQSELLPTIPEEFESYATIDDKLFSEEIDEIEIESDEVSF